MCIRTIAAIVLMATTSSAWGYQIRAFFEPNALDEGDGFQTVSVEVVGESFDQDGVCQMDLDVRAQPFFSEPPFNEATAGADYTPTTVTLSFSLTGGATLLTQTFNVPVINDDLVEIEQVFTAVIDQQSLTLAGDCDAGFNFDSNEDFFPIVDDDAGALSLSVNQAAIVVDEDSGSVDLAVTLSGADTIEGSFGVNVDWSLVNGTATFGSDYGNGGTSGLLSFDRNSPTQTVSVPVIDDAAIEAATEDFQLTLANPIAFFSETSNPPVALPGPTTTVQIADDDNPGTLTFANEPFQADETDPSATVTLRRSGGSAGTFTAFFTTADGSATAGSDYQPASGSVTWADGDAADKTFTVPILDDAAGEGDESVLVRAGTDPDLVEFVETTLTIADDEGVGTAAFSATAASAAEDADEVVITLVRGGSTAGAVSVDYVTADGTATAGEDYLAAAGTVSWADGDGADKTVVIQLIEDGDEEDAEDFAVNLVSISGSATLGSNSSITVTIGANDETRDIAEIPTLTPNQEVLARWFDQTCPRLAELAAPTADQLDLAGVCTAIRDIATDDAAVREALDAINPEELLVSTFNALRLTAVQHGNLSQRLNALRNGASGISLTGLDLEIDGQQIAGRALQEMFDHLIGGGASADEAGWGRWGGFVNGRLGSGDQDGSDNEAGFDFDLYSVTAGVDYRFRPNLILGLSAGFGSVDTDYQGGGGGLDIDSWTASAYMTYFREESFYLDAVVNYGNNDYDSRRQIGFAGAPAVFNRVARGETDGTQYSFGFGTGWDFNRAALTFGPHLGGYYFDVDVDGFAETGAGGLNVAVGDQQSQSLTVNSGGHLSYALLTGWGVLVPNAKVDWVHEFENSRETLSFSLANDPFAGDPNDPSPSITLQSNRPDSDYFIWSVGMSAQFIHGFSGFVSYQSYAGYGDVNLSEWSMGARWEKTF